MDRQDGAVGERLIHIVRDLLGKGAAVPIPFPKGRQLSELGLSSLKLVNLMVAVELEFDLTIPQSDITPENFHSVKTIEALIERMRAPVVRTG